MIEQRLEKLAIFVLRWLDFVGPVTYCNEIAFTAIDIVLS